MFSYELAGELHVRFIGVSTTRKLCTRDCIISTNAGWLITDIGRTALETGILP